jgi:hypothetical protein
VNVQRGYRLSRFCKEGTDMDMSCEYVNNFFSLENNLPLINRSFSKCS